MNPTTTLEPGAEHCEDRLRSRRHAGHVGKSAGLDPNDARDGAALAINGYTNVENYLNELAGDPVTD